MAEHAGHIDITHIWLADRVKGKEEETVIERKGTKQRRCVLLSWPDYPQQGERERHRVGSYQSIIYFYLYNEASFTNLGPFPYLGEIRKRVRSNILKSYVSSLQRKPIKWNGTVNDK